jgi:glycine/D-amino acid oxidase-like deaminating enzyme
MKVCVIGSGISGLSAAFYLSEYSDVTTTVYERASVFGGRANVTEDGEHCARLFLDDYSRLFAILKTIKCPDGRSVHDTLRTVKRYSHVEGTGWVAVSHMYSVLAKELSLVEKFRIARTRRASPLLAEGNIGANTNRYGSPWNYTPLSVARMAANFLKSKVAYSLEGPTDECLVLPWVRHLEERGVTLKKDAAVELIRAEADGVSIRSGGTWEKFDAVIASAFVSDLIGLLAASGLPHSVRRLNHTHCKCLTLSLDSREKVIAGGQPSFYVRNGLNVIVQPRFRRCVVLCTRSPSTREGYVLAKVRNMLDLEYEIAEVKVRDNQLPEEAVYAADYLDPDKLLNRRYPHVYFAGSYLKNSYPVDSGEGAARTAFEAVRRMRLDHPVELRHLVAPDAVTERP